MAPPLFLTAAQGEAVQGIVGGLACSLCQKLLEDPWTAECMHSFCRGCIIKYIAREHACPECQIPLIDVQLKQNSVLASCVGAAKRLEESLVRLTARGMVMASSTVVSLEPTMMMEVEPTQYSTQNTPAVEPNDAIKGGIHIENATDKPLDNKVEEESKSLPPPTCAPPSLMIPTTQQLDDMQSILHETKAKLDELQGNLVLDDIPKGEVVFLVSNLSGSQRVAQLKRLIKGLGGARLASSSFEGDQVTHLLMGESDESQMQRCNSTYKYYWALSSGIKIISERWLDDCEKRGRWASVRGYTMYSASSSIPLNRHYEKPMLFKGMTIALGPFASTSTVFTRNQCRTLLLLNGATILDFEGSEDGTLQNVSSEERERFGALEEKAILVGHPQEFNHRNKSCEFCDRVHRGLRVANTQVVEAAWVMLCLDSLSIRKYDEFAVARAMN